MDSPKPPQKPAQLLSDLESIRQLLEADLVEPPLLTDSLDPQSIPLLSDIVSPPPASASISQRPASAPTLHPEARELQRLEGELRAAAQLLLQDVIDDFVPQIEAELKRRLDARLDQLLARRRP